jgi:vacuolar-type H+-ATPase subunit H
MIARKKAKVRPPVEPYSSNKLSPLDQIRHVEAEVTRQVAVAHEAAGIRVADAKMQAEELIREARNAGYREGKTQLEEILSRAEEEAKAIIAQSQNQAGELRRKGRQRMEAAVRHALKIIISVDIEAKRNES